MQSNVICIACLSLFCCLVLIRPAPVFNHLQNNNQNYSWTRREPNNSGQRGFGVKYWKHSPMGLHENHLNIRIIDGAGGNSLLNGEQVQDDSYEGDEWLEDLESDEYTDQEQGTNEKIPSHEYPVETDSSQDASKCPPPPEELPSHSCHVTSCKSDKECRRDLRCCFNGCLYTCMVPVKPPAYLDWLKQPKGRLVSGNSLYPQELEVELCSTSEESYSDEEPLLCPHGYTCFVEDEGSESKDLPNRGRCVPEYPQLPQFIVTTPNQEHLVHFN